MLGFGSVFFLLYYGPIGRTSLDIGLESSSSGFGEVFYRDSEDEQFSAFRSVGVPVSQGANSVSFALPRLSNGSDLNVRWDPLDRPGEFRVRDIHFRNGLLNREVPVSNLKPSVDVSEVQYDEVAIFSTQSNDGQILLKHRLGNLWASSLTLTFAVATAASLLITTLFAAVLVRNRTGLQTSRQDLPKRRSHSVACRVLPSTVSLTVLMICLIFLVSWLSVV